MKINLVFDRQFKIDPFIFEKNKLVYRCFVEVNRCITYRYVK